MFHQFSYAWRISLSAQRKSNVIKTSFIELFKTTRKQFRLVSKITLKKAIGKKKRQTRETIDEDSKWQGCTQNSGKKITATYRRSHIDEAMSKVMEKFFLLHLCNYKICFLLVSASPIKKNKKTFIVIFQERSSRSVPPPLHRPKQCPDFCKIYWPQLRP